MECPALLRSTSHSTGFSTKVTFAKMRLPHLLLDSPFFLFTSADEFNKAMGINSSFAEFEETARLIGLGLPPISSRTALATMFGINPGLIWSFEKYPYHYYRTFEIKKGKSGKVRVINAPKVALKIIQKWLSVHLEKIFEPPTHVYGFVSGRSHIDAAISHCGSRWIFSADISDYFQTTPIALVAKSLKRIGFSIEVAILLAKLTCLNGNLAQGSPASPVLSNICFKSFDESLAEISAWYGVKMTRYADDIVFSGQGDFPTELAADVKQLFANGPWKLSAEKTQLATLPRRLKVHGLLVHSSHIRLTKGYRNKVRAYRHLLASEKIKETDLPMVRGHLHYADFIEVKVRSVTVAAPPSENYSGL